MLTSDRARDPGRHVVVGRPGGDRDAAERVAGDEQCVGGRTGRGEHRLDVLAEALDAVVAVGGRAAGSMAAEVVGHDPQTARRAAAG